MQVLSTLVLCFVQQCYIVPFAIFCNVAKTFQYKIYGK